MRAVGEQSLAGFWAGRESEGLRRPWTLELGVVRPDSRPCFATQGVWKVALQLSAVDPHLQDQKGLEAAVQVMFSCCSEPISKH